MICASRRWRLAKQHSPEAVLKTFVVIGGGASGLLMAVQLLRHQADRVTLVTSGEPGAGIAYGTEHPGHLLNVRAERMSAFPDQPDHFFDWLKGCARFRPAEGWSARSFAPRRVYRDYLQSLIAPFIQDPRLDIVEEQVVALVESPDGVRATLHNGRVIEAEAAVLATGNEAPSLQPEPWRHVGWSFEPIPAIEPDAPIAIVGTGLSMVDAVVSLLDAGHRGRIVAISRRGLVPRAHRFVDQAKFAPGDLPMADTLIGKLRWLRKTIRTAEAGGGSWISIVDGLRPFTQALWQSLSLSDQKRFLRHLRPWWDVHRHRMAPQIHARIADAQAHGQLRIVSARILDIAGNAEGAAVTVVRRGSTQAEQLAVRLVIECRGASGDLARSRNPVLADLRHRGTIRPDALRLGIDVAPDCRVVGKDGSGAERVFAVGPVTAGRFWEIVAMPDIREQVADLAKDLTQQAS